ncbi:MAG: sarcosine oxidase subunit delta, partial [Paracoccus sp. (in: a-proteobacteria)]|uniref:sarcosine oxidase subunit delta n=1 Tax=Paracoccus sp. TaxID=267 RepID=UPI003242B29C
TNARGPHFERWRHIHGCARFFNAVRDTVSDRFLMTYKAGEARPDLTVKEAAE